MACQPFNGLQKQVFCHKFASSTLCATLEVDHKLRTLYLPLRAVKVPLIKALTGKLPLWCFYTIKNHRWFSGEFRNCFLTNCSNLFLRSCIHFCIHFFLNPASPLYSAIYCFPHNTFQHPPSKLVWTCCLQLLESDNHGNNIIINNRASFSSREEVTPNYNIPCDCVAVIEANGLRGINVLSLLHAMFSCVTV